MDAAGGLAGSGDRFTDDLMAKAGRIQELAVKRRAMEISDGAGTHMSPGEEIATRGSYTDRSIATNILPGSRDWLALEDWYSWIPEVFGAFTDLTDPSGFDPLIDSVKDVCRVFDGPGSGPVKSTVWGNMNSARQWIGDWYGEAATQFVHFADPFQYLSANHGAIADVLYRAAAADRQVMLNARRDVIGIADATITALEAGDPVWGGDDVPLFLTVASAVLGFVSTVATGGVSLPIFFAATGAALGSVGAQAAGGCGDDGKPKEGAISGLTADAILDSMLSALRTLENSIEAEEQKIIAALTRNIRLITDPGHRYDIVGKEPMTAGLDRRSIPTKFVPPS